MTTLRGKIAKAVLVSSILGSLLLAVPAAPIYAASLKIYSVSKRTDNSITLPIKYSNFKNSEIVARVRIQNKDSGKVIVRDFKTKLNSDGRVSLTINKLDSDTKYSIKVKVRKESNDKFTSYSSSKTVKTLN